MGTAARTLALKVVLDQLVTMPPYIYVFYIGKLLPALILVLRLMAEVKIHQTKIIQITIAGVS